MTLRILWQGIAMVNYFDYVAIVIDIVDILQVCLRQSSTNQSTIYLHC